jgi:hypothetical protein
LSVVMTDSISSRSPMCMYLIWYLIKQSKIIIFIEDLLIVNHG